MPPPAALLLLLPAACVAAGPSPGFNDASPGTSTYAAFSILLASEEEPSLVPVVGPVEKHSASPLFTGTEEWEHNIDNGYSSVLYDPQDKFGLGKYRAYYSAGDDHFGGSIPGESQGSATLYATSHDGISFTKPDLGRVSFKNSTANNILLDGTTAVAMYDDSFHDNNVSSRFKLWGNLPGPPLPPPDKEHQQLGYTAQLAGSAVSSDGLHFTDYRRLQNPSKASKVCSIPDLAPDLVWLCLALSAITVSHSPGSVMYNRLRTP